MLITMDEKMFAALNLQLHALKFTIYIMSSVVFLLILCNFKIEGCVQILWAASSI